MRRVLPRAMSAVVAVGGCWHDAPRPDMPAPAPAPATMRRWAVTMGPARPVAEELNIRVRGLPPASFPGLGLPPLSPIALCGRGLFVGDTPVSWCVDGKQLFVDDNANGDLADDPPHALSDDGYGLLDATLGDRFIVNVRGGGALVVFRPLFVRQGILDIEGRQLGIRVYGWFGRYGVPIEGHASVDLDGYSATDDHVDIWDHHRLRIAVEPDGSKVTLTSRRR